jgi:hypothetical protein
MSHPEHMLTIRGRDAISGGDHEIAAAVNADGSIRLTLGGESIVISSRDFLSWIERIITSPCAMAGAVGEASSDGDDGH